MEGLVKGLINVAFGDGEDDRNDDRRNAETRGERSRSTWAEVVSGEQDNDEVSSDRRQGYQRENDYGQNRQRYEGNRQEGYGQHSERYGYSRQEDYGQSHGNEKVEQESSDGWETVQKKHPKRQQKVHMDHWDNYKKPADEQDYSNEVECGVDLEPSGEELEDLSKACNKLWELDLNRLVPGRHYEIDVGEGKKVYQKDDMAEGNLFSWLSEDVLQKPTYSRFCALLDNYNPREGYKENVTAQEQQEQLAFIEEISRTAPIKYLHKYLSAKRMVSENYQEFKRMLKSLWFDLYGRGGTSGSSSAFEHVFVGEIKQRGEEEVSGFHNWLQFYLEEAKGNVDYQGYIFPRRRGEIPDSETQLLTIQFEWNGVLKSVSSTLVGVSPEFELAIYTLCFFAGGQENHVELGPYSVNIKCYHLGDKIGSAFPVAEC
ncbi:PREDICTED: poly(U)-specific endoribonuclease-B-like isoform X2 [Ipomoea nil]|uniref:poly(U)-specific endoribonuclease-B-like isoform X2 n=1 Tax=Ipomoea nil TaxID=35883 RepID=UPI00090110E8|nr:PREDICTED: poly(U)-specific endoribonuclease-B-like isoform X2 [Ipomoea nil]